MHTNEPARFEGLGGAALAAFQATLEASALPYGYTLTIFSSGTLLSRVRGAPSVPDIFLFVAGGIAAFVALGAVVALARREHKPVPAHRAAPLLSGGLAWIGAGGAVGASALVAEIPSAIAWPAGSFVATSAFLVGASLQLALAARLGRPRPGSP